MHRDAYAHTRLAASEKGTTVVNIRWETPQLSPNNLITKICIENKMFLPIAYVTGISFTRDVFQGSKSFFSANKRKKTRVKAKIPPGYS